MRDHTPGPYYRSDVPLDPDAGPEGAAAPGRGAQGTAAAGDDEFDRALDEEFASGKPDALEAAYRRYGAVVHGYARRAAGVEAADEVTQDVFLAAWRSSSRYDPGQGSLGGWLMGIAKFKVADHLRALYRNRSVASGDLVDLGTSSDGSSTRRSASATRILVATRSMSPSPADEPGSTWIRMAFVDGLSHSEIAERTGAPLGTVKSTIRRGLQRIRRDLEVFDAQA